MRRKWQPGFDLARAAEPREHTGSQVLDARGELLCEASEDRDELVTADMDMDQVRAVRNLWQFFRDRRPETYGSLTAL